MSKNPHKLTIGQELYFSPSDRRDKGRYLTIEKIGNKWATTKERSRICMETLRVDGGGYSSPGVCFLTKQEHDNVIEKKTIWQKIRMEFNYQTPSCTLDDMRKVAKLLGVNHE